MRMPMLLATGYKLPDEPLVFTFRPLTAANTLFLDRDGVLIHPVLRGLEVSSPRCLEEVRIADDIDALAATDITRHWNIVVVSNQPDLARGRINLKLVKGIHERISRRIPLNAVYICPHQQSDGCVCRKPRLGLIQRFRSDHPESGGKECMVGDRFSDRDCAQNAGIPFVLRKRPYNEELALSTVLVIDNLWDLRILLTGMCTVNSKDTREQ